MGEFKGYARNDRLAALAALVTTSNAWSGQRHLPARSPPVADGRCWGTLPYMQSVFALKWKIWRIESCAKALLLAMQMKPHVWSFGAYYIDPKHIVFVVGVPSDRERDLLRSDAEFASRLRDLLVRFNWPRSARDLVVFDIESQETVDRDTQGNWWYHYK